MSMPRAATSVATSTDSSPLAKRRIARSRADCGRSPWIAAALTPSSCSAMEALSHIRLVPQNTTVFDAPRDSAATTRALSMWCTARNRWRIVPTVSVGESTETSTGWLR